MLYNIAFIFTALLFFPFALMPRGQLLSYVTKVTKDTPKGFPLGNPLGVILVLCKLPLAPPENGSASH